MTFIFSLAKQPPPPPHKQEKLGREGVREKGGRKDF